MSLLRPTFLKEAWIFLLLRPCGLAFEATRSKTRRALDEIRKDTYPVLVIRKILQRAPDSLVTDSPVAISYESQGQGK